MTQMRTDCTQVQKEPKPRGKEGTIPRAQSREGGPPDKPKGRNGQGQKGGPLPRRPKRSKQATRNQVGNTYQPSNTMQKAPTDANNPLSGQDPTNGPSHAREKPTRPRKPPKARQIKVPGPTHGNCVDTRRQTNSKQRTKKHPGRRQPATQPRRQCDQPGKDTFKFKKYENANTRI